MCNTCFEKRKSCILFTIFIGPFLRTDDSRYLVLTDIIPAERMKKLRVLLLVWKLD